MFVEERYIEVPADLAIKSEGLGFDIGGSLAKVIFKDSTCSKISDDGKYGRLKAVCFKRDDWEKVAEHLKANACLTRPSGERISRVFNSGVGGFTFAAEIGKQIDCQIETLSEFDTFVYGFRYLSQHLPRKMLLESIHEDEVEEQVRNSLDFIPKMKKTHETGHTNGDSLDAAEPEALRARARGLYRGDENSELPLEMAESESFYPYLIAMVGSGTGYMVVREDGGFAFVDGRTRGGRSTYGLATLLTGCKDYADFLEMAGRGVEQNINTGLLDMSLSAPSGDNDGLYADLFKGKANIPLYSFGKAAGAEPGSFKKEDIAAALHFHACQEVVEMTVDVACANGCRRVFFMGNFVRSEFTRKVMISALADRNCLMYNLVRRGIQADGVTADFVKGGGYIGAVGCVLNTLHKFLPRDVKS